MVREATADTDAGIDAVSVFLGPLIGGGSISYAAEMSETPDVSESPGKAGETEVTVRLEEPTEEATDTEEPDLDTEDPAESVKQPENSGVSETTEQEEPEEPGESEKDSGHFGSVVRIRTAILPKRCRQRRTATSFTKEPR